MRVRLKGAGLDPVFGAPVARLRLVEPLTLRG